MPKHHSNRSSLISLSLSAVVAVGLAACAETNGSNETTATAGASPFLPPALLVGPLHETRSTGPSESYQNSYAVRMAGQDFPTTGDVMVGIRAAEARAIARLDTYLTTGAYNQGAAAAERRVGAVARAGGTLPSGLTNGMATLTTNERARAALPSVMAEKRRLAKLLQVNPYSDNAALQKRLSLIAWSVAVGGATAPQYQIHDSTFEAGIWPSLVGLRGLGVAVFESSPERLATWNRDTLRNMGIEAAQAERVMSSPYLTPLQRTAIVQGMARIPARGRREFFDYVLEADDADDGLFLQIMAQMAFGYHTGVARLSEVVTIAGLPVFYNERGDVVILLPVDNLPWTAEVRLLLDQLTGPVRAQRQIAEIELWLTGKATPTALDESRLRRVKLFETSSDFLIPGAH